MEQDNELVYTVRIHGYGDASELQERIRQRLDKICALNFMTYSVESELVAPRHDTRVV